MNIQAALVRSILEQWRSYTWTVQGFGFLRTKIADVGRIHIWDSRLATPLVSNVHTHPWPLHSTVISGELINQRFTEVDNDGINVMHYLHSRIKTGEGGGLTGSIKAVKLWAATPEFYPTGRGYDQEPQEIHRTIAIDGTVTLLERPQGPPLEEADTYWPEGTGWVSAEPKPAEEWRITSIIEYALARWSA